MLRILIGLMAACISANLAFAQRAPSATEAAGYDGLLAATHAGDVAGVTAAIASGADLAQADGNGRTAVHVAAFASHEDVLAALATAGADMNRLDNDLYDAVTIAAVANDTDMLNAAIAAGNSAANTTSIYDGTALIAAAHLGHHEVVKILIDAGAPLDHVNNLNWTAMIEAVVLGDGGANHQKTLAHLIEAGANRSIADGQGRTPLDLARARGYGEIVAMLED